VTTGEVTEHKGALLALSSSAADLQAVQSILADSGDIGQPFVCAIEELLGAEVQIAKRSELHTFAVMPLRWVVERSFDRIEKCRRRWKKFERNSTPAYSSFISPFWCFCSEDREQAKGVWGNQTSSTSAISQSVAKRACQTLLSAQREKRLRTESWSKAWRKITLGSPGTFNNRKIMFAFNLGC
jgi:transposase